MAQTTADFLVDRLHAWGVRRIYGYPGDGINGIMGALERADGKIDFVQVRHEEMAAFMACAHAKFTGEPGICLATSGPGAIHLLNGLYDAKLDHQPVVAIVGQAARMAMGGSYQQEVDLQSLFKDVAGEYVQTAMAPAQMRHLIDRAIRIARAERTVTCIIIPHDLQDEKMAEPPRKHGSVHSGVGYTSPRILPSDDDLKRAAEVLNAGEKVAMLIGAGAFDAADEVVEVAELLGAGVAKALLGKAALPDDLPFVTGSIGLLGTKPSWTLMDECDTLLMVGSSFPYSEFLPEEGKARGVQIDIDGRMLSIRYPMEVNLTGDSKETLRALIPRLVRKQDRAWRTKLEEEIRDWWKVLEEHAMVDAAPINPERVFWELSPRLPEGAIVAADSGSTASWYARHLKFRKGMMGSLSGNLATMGPGVPYVIAAKFAFPSKVAIACVGDGAFQMNGMNEMITIAKYWKEWSDPRLIVCVLKNRDLNMVTWEQRVMAGDAKFAASQIVPDFPYAQYAESIGLKGIRVETCDRVAAGWDEAFAAKKPCVIEFHTDPEVPPLPPHITLEEARMFMRAVRHDPDRGAVIKESFKQKIEELIPGR
ncbi:MAG TPA: thiamine pyrophosphate-requiring protein [Thermoanaerobaculia bacterium]|nr:thiamine pyrophosphate-requiring protein [Thermoanaerobaculia bacterium]